MLIIFSCAATLTQPQNTWIYQTKPNLTKSKQTWSLCQRVFPLVKTHYPMIGYTGILTVMWQPPPYCKPPPYLEIPFHQYSSLFFFSVSKVNELIFDQDRFCHLEIPTWWKLRQWRERKIFLVWAARQPASDVIALFPSSASLHFIVFIKKKTFSKSRLQQLGKYTLQKFYITTSKYVCI